MRVATLSFAVLMCAFCLCPANAENWPQFRGARGDGVPVKATHPEKWSAEEHLAWKTKLDGVGWSQPIVWDGKVFVTTAVAENQKRPKPGDWSPAENFNIFSAIFGTNNKPPNLEYQWKLICLDAGTGSVIWEQTAHTGKPKAAIHPNNTFATETPVTDGERIVASFGMNGVYCYDFSGKLLWKKDLETLPIQMDWGTGSSPVIHNDLVLLQCDNNKASYLVALNKNSGDQVWRIDRDEQSNWATPLLWKSSQRTELVAGGGKRMRSYDPATGKLLWEMAASGRCSSSPVAKGDVLYVDSGDRLTGQRGILAAIKVGGSGDITPASGSTTGEFVLWSSELPGHRVASPIIAGDCLFTFEVQAGIVRCLDAATGKTHYRQRLPGATGLTASGWTRDGKVFCPDQSGQTFVLAAEPTFTLVTTNKLADEMFWASPAIAGDTLFLRGIDHLFCIR